MRASLDLRFINPAATARGRRIHVLEVRSTPCCTTPPTEEGHESGAPEAGHAQAHGRGGALETCGHAELVRRAEHLSDPTSSRPCLARNRAQPSRLR